ncbi:putative lipoprotein LprB [Nocardia camponoti]|uniref:Lipoprotein LprB n=1 Tax=Nocardia camponoti TaxID=1616106 RepID=A0A917QGZ8_9NOCA|nr:putative lipoprotein LprB [Nocardia camponoti]
MATISVLSACGSSSDDSPGPVRQPPKVASLGPFVGECGHVTDDEVRSLAGIGSIARSFKNSTGCNWQAAGMTSPSVTFASYRGSPIERERAWVSNAQRTPKAIQVAGKPGFEGLDPSGAICDLAVQLDDDFFEWSMSYGAFGKTGNPCDNARKLAELTIGRLG